MSNYNLTCLSGLFFYIYLSHSVDVTTTSSLQRGVKYNLKKSYLKYSKLEWMKQNYQSYNLYIKSKSYFNKIIKNSI